jgi:molybdate transport repressor ModE-like protein
MSENWRSVELKHLLALREIAETGSFWAAAERLRTSQSTISDHIRSLEALVGRRLIERSRGRRTVRLTDAGRLLLGHASAIAARLQAAEADFRAIAAGEAGTLRVGIYESIANKVLPEVLRTFEERWPKVDVQLLEATVDSELTDGVERGELDVSFAVHPIPPGPFQTRDLIRDAYVLVVPATSELAGRRPSVGDLAGVAMVGYLPSRTFELAEEFLRGRGVTPRFVFRSHDNGTVQAMVGAGLGVALMPLLAVDERDPATRIVLPEETIPARVVAAVWHRDRYRPAFSVGFVELASEVAAAIERKQDRLLAAARSAGAGR